MRGSIEFYALIFAGTVGCASLERIDTTGFTDASVTLDPNGFPELGGAPPFGAGGLPSGFGGFNPGNPLGQNGGLGPSEFGTGGSLVGNGGFGAVPSFPTGGAPSAGGAGTIGPMNGGSNAGGSSGSQNQPPPRASGGKPNANNGGASAGGKTSSGSGGAAEMCTSSQKMCGGMCTVPTPSVGCGPTGCEPCSRTAPSNGFLKCTSGECDFDCLSGYDKSDAGCAAPPPENKGSCPSSALGCPSCGAVFGPGCCDGDKCGCSPIPWTVGILGCI